MFKTQLFLRKFLLSTLLASMLVAGFSQAAEKQQTKSLYDRLGGVYPISVVVETFIDVLLVNDVLNANPAIRASRASVPAAGLKYHVTALVCQTTGGPCTYTGRSMKDSHTHLNITENEWQAMLADFRRVLNNYEVPTREQEELVAIVESKKADIVVNN